MCFQLIHQRALDCGVLDKPGYNLFVVNKQRNGIPLLFQSAIYNIGGHLKTSYKMALSSGELSISDETQTFNPQLCENLQQQKYQDTYIYSFFTAQLITVIQLGRQWQILSGSLNQLLAKILGDRAIATEKASPLALCIGGNAHQQEGCQGVNAHSYWDRHGQMGG